MNTTYFATDNLFSDWRNRRITGQSSYWQRPGATTNIHQIPAAHMGCLKHVEMDLQKQENVEILEQFVTQHTKAGFALETFTLHLPLRPTFAETLDKLVTLLVTLNVNKQLNIVKSGRIPRGLPREPSWRREEVMASTVAEVKDWTHRARPPQEGVWTWLLTPKSPNAAAETIVGPRRNVRSRRGQM